MTALAPGRDAAKAVDGSCFNCGSHDHFTINCPEQLREVPHGAAMIRQRAANAPGGGRLSDGRPQIVVTKYANPASFAPPPSVYPPPAANAWGHNVSYPPPPMPAPQYGQRPPQPYPPPHQAQQPYPSPYPPANGYGPPMLPPQSMNRGYGPPPPPPPGAAPYGPYAQASYQPPPPTPYGPPGSYMPPPYPQGHQPSYQGPPPLQPNYQRPPQPNYQGPPQPNYHGPPAPGYQGPPPNYGQTSAPNFQGPPHGYHGPPVPLPPPSAYASGYGSGYGPPGQTPPPPPGMHPPPGPAYPPNSQPAAPYTNPHPSTQSNSGWQKDSGGSHSHRHNRARRPDKNIKNKNNRRDQETNSRELNQRHGTSSQRSAATSRQGSPKPISVVSEMAIETHKLESAKLDEANLGTPDIKEDAVSKENQFDPDTLWDFEKAFIEVEHKPADPVGKPLAATWNDTPTIPPAYDAKCIKSEYYDPGNPDAFLASVRDTKYWPDLKQDPVFRFRSGMVVVQFPGSHHEYFTYHLRRRIEAKDLKGLEVLPGPSDVSLVEKPRHSHAAVMHHRHSDSPSISINGKRNIPEADEYGRDAKRPRNQGLDRSPIPRQPLHSTSRDFDLDTDPWAPQAGETHPGSPHPFSREGYSHSPGGYRLQSNGRLAPYDSSQRQDSGYHSSTDRYRSGRDDKSNHHLSTPTTLRVQEHDGSRERVRERDQSRGRDTDRGGHRGRSWDRDPDRSRPPSLTKKIRRSRSRSRTPTPPDGGSEDDMDDLEYELLGMRRPKSPRRKPMDKPLMRRPRTKVADAFSRRW